MNKVGSDCEDRLKCKQRRMIRGKKFPRLIPGKLEIFFMILKEYEKELIRGR